MKDFDVCFYCFGTLKGQNIICYNLTQYFRRSELIRDLDFIPSQFLLCIISFDACLDLRRYLVHPPIREHHTLVRQAQIPSRRHAPMRCFIKMHIEMD